MYSDDADNNTLKPQLAERWDVDDTGITFHLREAKLASGNPVTAKDIAFSLIIRLLKLN